MDGKGVGQLEICKTPIYVTLIVRGASLVPSCLNPHNVSTIQAGSRYALQIVSATNAACNSYSNVTYLVSY